MMKVSKVAGLTVAAVVIAVAGIGLRSRQQESPARVAVVAPDGSRRTSSRELAALMKSGDVIVLDVRDVDAYVAGHLEGALHIPLSYIQGEIPYLRKGKPIVTYCT
jgi:predicted sulfurtransferase